MPPEPNDQMVEPELGDEDMNAWLESLGDQTIDIPSLLSQPVNQPVAQEGGDEPDDEPDPNEPPDPNDPNAIGDNGETPPPPTEGVEGVDYFTVNGNRIDRADVERLYAFDQYMRQDAAAAQRVAEALRQPTATQPGQPPVSETTPPGTPPGTGTSEQGFVEPTPPEGFDLEDPHNKFMWDSMVSLQKSQYEMTQQINQERQARAQELQRQAQTQAQRDMESALSKFRTTFPGLNDEDITTIRTEATPLVQGYMQQLPPVDALYRSMEVAAYANSDMRQKLELSTPAPTNQQRSSQRKRKLGSVAGTPRSAPREAPRQTFTTDRDMVQALADGISDQLAGR